MDDETKIKYEQIRNIQNKEEEKKKKEEQKKKMGNKT